MRSSEEKEGKLTAMSCPYCGKEMRPGWIRGRDPVYWDNEEYMPGIDDDEGRVRLSEGTVFAAPRAEAHYCEACRIVLLPVRDVESVMDRLDKKWSALAGKMSEQREALKAQREEEKQEKAREKRRRDDPWED